MDLPFENIQQQQEEIISKIDTLDFQIEILLEQNNMTYAQFLRKASLNCEAFFEDSRRCANTTEIMTSAGKCFRMAGIKQVSFSM